MKCNYKLLLITLFLFIHSFVQASGFYFNTNSSAEILKDASLDFGISTDFTIEMLLQIPSDESNTYNVTCIIGDKDFSQHHNKGWAIARRNSDNKLVVSIGDGTNAVAYFWNKLL